MILIAIILVLIGALYLYGTRTFKYWEVRGVNHDKPYPFVGTAAKVFLAKMSITQATVDTYKRYHKEKLVGLYRSTKPELLVRDPEIIKRILTNNFMYYYPRGFLPKGTSIEPMMQNLFFADGDLWRLLRQRMTPAFTSGKLKAMFPLIVEHAEKLQGLVLEAAADGKPLDARDVMARYTTDFIGACGFGLNSDSLNDKNSHFRTLGANIFSYGFKECLILLLKEIMPRTFSHLKYLNKIEQDVIDLVNHILKQRNHKVSGRNDFIDLMLECQLKGTIKGESIEKLKPDGTGEEAQLEITDELIAAQVFVFFAAGFETSSSATSFTLHELAYNPDVQKKVQEHVDEVLRRHNNKLSYEAVKDMTYLTWTFQEGMRKFPSLGFLRRTCARKHYIPEADVTVEEGVGVIIPLQALHNDPQYFDEPEKFNPERFDPVNISEHTKYVYLPFGVGPRACIGERLGLMQSLAGLAAILSRFTVEPAPRSLRNPIVNPRSHVVQSVKYGLPLYFRERKDKLVS